MRKNLIIATVGDSSLHRYWVKDEHPSFDLFLIYYGDNKGYPKESDRYLQKKGPKFHLISEAIEKSPEILDYDYIWMPDDDIYLDPSQIEELFSIARDYDLWICQPSLMGYYGLAVTLNQADCLLRYTNYVEIMCPCFKNEALKKCLKTFKENKTGWGIDALWNVVLEHPTDKLAIIDKIIAVHTRPIGGGDVYKNLTENGMADAMKEARELHKKYNLAESSRFDLTKGRLVSQESFYLLYFNTVEYSRIHKSTETGIPVKNRLWPNNHAISEICHVIRKNTLPKPNKIAFI